MPKPTPRDLPRWRITLIRASRAVEVGIVKAPDAATAIVVAIEEYDITEPEKQKRLAAYRVDDARASGPF